MIAGIGVDVVDLARFERSIERTPKLRERLFTEAERPLPVHSLAARFAAKEALIKADGRGFACTTTLFSVTTDAGAPRVLSHASEPDFVHRWAVADLEAVPGFAAAVVWASGNTPELVYWDAGLC